MKPILPAALFLSFIFSAQQVAAHGFINQFTVGGKVYPGNSPGGPSNPSTIRQISTNSPVKGSGNPALNCGPDARPASLTATVNPGDTIAFDWKAGGGQNWPHNTGPMLTYMASCGTQTCDRFDTTTARWFKIDQIGRGSDGNWLQQQVMNGAPANVRIPANIAPGNYMVRHEIIALHLGTSIGGAEFYPGCAQLIVTGTGSGRPSNNELVSFPGGYSDNDPGIFVPDVFNRGASYTFPGPPIAQFVTSPASPAPTTTSSSITRAPTATPTPGSSSSNTTTTAVSHCRLRRSTSVSHHRPRQLSRIMRDLVHSGLH